MNEIQIKISREDKLIAIGINKNLPKSQISEAILDELYNINLIKKQKEQILSNKKTNINIKKTKKTKIDCNDNKYIITMEFLNAILKIIGKIKINDITEFKDIRREDLLKNECKDVLEEYLNKIIKCFGKTKIAFRNKDIVNLYILTVIKCLCMECGYNFKSCKKIINTTITTNNYRHKYIILYNIID